MAGRVKHSAKKPTCGQRQYLSRNLIGMHCLPLPLLTNHARRYLPGHPEDVRTRVQKEWTDHLSLPNYSLTRFMSSESEMLQWKAEGLPADLLSLQVRGRVTCSSCSWGCVVSESRGSSYLTVVLIGRKLKDWVQWQRQHQWLSQAVA
jgi:hypothetical protein